MLEIVVKSAEFYQPSINKFINTQECTLTLEHSLISISKWESKWKIPYFSDTPKTERQYIDYLKCMTIGNVKEPNVYYALSSENLQEISEYMADSMTATTFTTKQNQKRGKADTITAELLYARMCTYGIPFECQKWHINKLLTLIKVCDLQNSPRDRMGKKETSMWNAEQNAARRAKYNTRG